MIFNPLLKKSFQKIKDVFSWSEITDKPDVYPPEEHEHSQYAGVAFNTINNGLNYPSWSLVATINISLQYRDSNHVFIINSVDDSSGTIYVETVMFGVKQQLAFGSDPYIELIQYSYKTTSFSFGFVIEQNTPSTIVHLYVKNLFSNRYCSAYRIGGDSTDSFTEFYSYDPLLFSEPLGIIYGQKYGLYHSGNFQPSQITVSETEPLDPADGDVWIEI